jgi:hypothetical protein
MKKLIAVGLVALGLTASPGVDRSVGADTSVLLAIHGTVQCANRKPVVGVRLKPATGNIISVYWTAFPAHPSAAFYGYPTYYDTPPGPPGEVSASGRLRWDARALEDHGLHDVLHPAEDEVHRVVQG